MHISLSTVIPLVAIFAYLVLLITVSISRPLNTMRSRFRLYLIAMLIWAFAAFLVLLDLGHSLFWFRLMTSGAVASMIALFYFTQAVINRDFKGATLVYISSSIAILVNQFTGLVTPAAQVINGKVIYEFTNWVAGVAGPSYIIMLVSIFQLVKTARASRDDTQIARYTFLAAAIVIILIGGSLNFTELGQYPVDIVANILAAVIITFAILRHKLLDINVVIRKSALYVIPTIIVGAIYFLLITLALEVFHADSSERLFSVSIVVSMIAALLIQPFRDYLQSTVDKFFFRERYNAVQMLQRVSQTASSVIDLQELTHMILQEITDTMYIEKAALFLKYNGKRNLMVASQIGTRISPRTIVASDHPLVAMLSNNTVVLTHPELAVDQKFRSAWEGEKEVINKLGAEIYVPLNVKGELVGMFSFGPKLSDQAYTSEDKQTLLTLAQQTGVAVQNAQLYSTAQEELRQRRETEKRLQLQLKRLSALQDINMAITTNIDLQIPLYLLLEQVTEQLGVDAADVLLFDEENQQLFFVAGRGFQTEALKYTKLDMGQGLAGKAAELMETIHINDLRNEETSLSQAPLLTNESFVAYFGVPLIAKGKIQGVLEIFHRSPLEPDEDWMNFLNTLTSETAIAVENAQMFRDLEKSNLDLVVAYETTLEGWAKTLELRDRETEGHSQRVLDLTTRLARKLGVADDEMIHLQRGAVLHDIGKMGVPDNILMKEGSLTDEEWEIMHKHPRFAQEMLESIPFLKKAAEIPYCHHEKWDGSGYPNRLRGEEIPISARIFALVDVWDALRSDRPYRKAWSDEQALQYIHDEVGKHFDPSVVKAFDEIILLEQRIQKMK